MSSSVFRDIDEERYSSSGSKSGCDDVEDEKLKLEQNLVILVNNKSGKVSVDERTLHSLLANETTNTSVSIVRVSSPTPSMQDEMDEEDRQNLEMSQEELMQTLTEGDDSTLQPAVLKKTVPRVGITVESYYPPEEAKHFVAEVLSLAGIDNPITIDYEFQRYVIQNDHCYTNLRLPTKTKVVSSKKHGVFKVTTPVKQPVEESVKDLELSPRSQRIRKPSTRLLESNETEPKKEEADVETTPNKDEEEPFENSGSEYESEDSETSIEDNDNDSDLDFDINRSNRPPKKGKKKRKVPKSKAILRNSGSKIGKKRQSTRSIDSEEPDTSKEKSNKSQIFKKTVTEKRAPQRKVVSKGKQPPADPKEAGIVPSAVQAPPLVQDVELEIPVKPIPVPSTSSVSQPQQALTSIVKKDKKKEAHLDALFIDMSSLFSKPDKIKKIDVKTPVQMPQINKNTKQGIVSEQLDLIDSIVQNELAHNASIVESEMAEELPSIVKMLENPENDLQDNALLETLGESLPEDFLHTVAELAENKEIQEIIDKQVLGVDIDQALSSTSAVVHPITTLSSQAIISTPIQAKHTKTPNISLTEARKHPLKVMRSDGRVITLPPIEVPTTRGAKKRLQGDTAEASPVPSRDSSLVVQSESKVENTVTPAKIKTSVSKDEKEAKHRSREQSREKSTSRRSSVNRSSTDGGRRDSTSGSKRKRAITNPAVLAVLNNEKADDSESGESWNSEDDPDRLWCICRQPHNNRFMICCDVCEDWFHGKCVNITKAQGNVMESEGKDWTCPNCIKKKQEKEQPKITSFMNESGDGKKFIKSGNGNKLCIVCKRTARTGSIYCSDECIARHAQDALVSTKLGSTSSNKSEIIKSPLKAHTSSEDVDFDKQIKTSKIAKNKEDRVIVFEKSTNRCLTGANAPTAQNLKQWLKEHPTFQAVTPGTAQMNAIMAKRRQLKEVASKMQAEKQSPKDSSSLFSKPTKVQTKLKFSESQKLTIASPKEMAETTKLPTLKSPTPKTTPTTPASSSHARHSAGKSSHEKKVVKRQSSTDSQKTTPGSKDSRDHDIIRLKSKEGLQAALEERMVEVTEANAPRLTSDEIKEFANNVENELYSLFNKDCNQKYRVKYRSLVFNIRDRKNLTLFQKICEKSIKPYRLVRMEPQEMASQELAQWRENENKHQLEMIKKSELELLACSKNYVLKTHKGEEVVESKKVDRVQLDPNMAVEDVVKVLNSSSASTSVVAKPSSSSTGQHKGHDDSYYVKSYTHVDDKGHGSHLKDKDKDKKHHHSSKHTKHKRKHSRDRSESRHHSHDNKKSRKSPERSSSSRHESKKDKKHEKRSPERAKEREKKKPVKEFDIPTPTQEDFNLIDKILEGSQVVLTRPGIQPPAPSRPSTSVEETKTMASESDQEPTSTVNIPTPPHTEFQRDPSPPVQQETIWMGNMNMVDVASFRVEAKPVAGDVKSIISHFPKSLEIVGRITPETVWDYIDKIQKSPNKEIIVVRFSSTDDLNYLTLYKYYELRRRLGVIKSLSSVIKDFYVFPLPAGKNLPSVLSSIKGVGFVEGKNKPDLLIGVIVKIKRDKLVKPRPKVKQQVPLLPPIITKQSLENIDPSFSLAEESTSRSSRTSKLLTLGLPKATSDEDDEPYSPGDSDENDVSSSIVVTTSTIVTVEEAVKLDEINREIQARKMEIAGMLNVDPDSLDEPYSPSRPVSPPTLGQPSILPGLDKIAIPSNLSEILASIKSSAQSSTKEDANDEYDPTTTTAGGIGLGYYQSTALYKASGYTETTQVSISEQRGEEQAESSSQHGEKRKLGEGDLDLRIMPPSQIPVAMDEPATNDEDCFEIPDEEGVKRARWNEDDSGSQNETVSEATGDLDLRMLTK